MIALRRRFIELCLVLVVSILIGSLLAVGQTQPDLPKPPIGASTAGDTPPGSSPSPPTSKLTTPSLQSKLAADVSSSRDLGDYIPCEFGRADLLNLRPQPDILTLTSADEDTLRSRIISEALDSSNASGFPANMRDVFVRHIAEASFVGLTPSQATGKILYLLAQDTAPSPEVSDLLNAAAKGNKTFADFLQNNYEINSKETMDALGQGEQAPQAKLSAAVNLARGKVATAKPNESSLVAKELVSAASLQKTASEGQTTLAQGPAKNQVAEAVQQTTAAITRPLDVACSMAVLSYETTRYSFGQRMADEFIPIQIVVRNLNPNKEFLVHDAQFGVDDDINGRVGRYASGVDKLTARTFMLASRDYGHRNLVVHLAQGVGTILSSSSLVYGSAVKDAANVYSAGFLNALTGVWTDHGTDQLNLLNDEGFSSYRTERTVVPKSGTAEFVIFIRSDQYQEGWWVQDCAENIVIKNPDQVSQISSRQSAKCIGQMNLQSPDPKCLASAEISVDLEAARRVCLHFYKDAANRSLDVCSDSDNTCEPKLIDMGTDKDIKGDFAYFKPNSVRYKKWSPRAVALFRELSLAVIAGTHIEEEANTTPSLTKIDCGPPDGKGDVDFDKAENNTIKCTLTGTNLDSVHTVKLQNAADLTDKTTAIGDVSTTTSGNSKSTTAVFTLDALGKLPGKSYKVSTVTKDGVETPWNLFVNLSGEPYLPAAGQPDPASLNLADLLGKDGKPIPVTLKGYHLDSLQSVRFAKSANDKTSATVTPFDVSVDPGSTATQALVTVKPEDMKKAKVTGDFSTQKLEFSVALISKDAPNVPLVAKQLLYGTGNVAVASSPPKTAKGGKAPPK